jgi:hypothetical protein
MGFFHDEIALVFCAFSYECCCLCNETYKYDEFRVQLCIDDVFDIPSSFPPWARHRVSEHANAKVRNRTSSERVCMSKSRLIDLSSASSFTASIKVSKQMDRVVFPSATPSLMQTGTCSTRRGAICRNLSLRQKARRQHSRYDEILIQLKLTSFIGIEAFCESFNDGQPQHIIVGGRSRKCT